MSKILTALDCAKRAGEDRRARSAPKVDATLGTAHRGNKLANLKNLRSVNIDWRTFDKNRLLRPDSASKHPAQGAYRMLRTRLMQNMRTNGWKVLGVSSVGQNEGKTFTAINLAISIAAEIGQEVILVDMDLRRPSVHTYLGIDESDFTDLKDYLEEPTQDLGSIMVSPGIDRLGALLSANPLEQSSDLLASSRGKELFSELRGQLPTNAVVVVDLPPLLVADDALAIAPMLDGLLLVVAETQTERNELAEAQQMLQAFNIVGTVLNKSVEYDKKRTHYY